jgi:hypothetical protein
LQVRPPGKPFRFTIEECYVSARVGGNHRVANARERHIAQAVTRQRFDPRAVLTFEEDTDNDSGNYKGQPETHVHSRSIAPVVQPWQQEPVDHTGSEESSKEARTHTSQARAEYHHEQKRNED